MISGPAIVIKDLANNSINNGLKIVEMSLVEQGRMSKEDNAEMVVSGVAWMVGIFGAIFESKFNLAVRFNSNKNFGCSVTEFMVLAT